MNNIQKLIRIMLTVTWVLTVALSVVSTVANLLCLDNESLMYATAGSGILKTFYVTSAVTVAAAAVFCILNKKSFSTVTVPEDNSVSRWLGRIAGAVFLVGATVRFTLYVQGEVKYNLSALAITAMLIMLFCSSFYFFSEKDAQYSKTVLLPCGLLGVAALVIDIIAIYSDMTQPISSEYKIMTALFTLAILLYWVAELRMKIAEPNPTYYLATMLIATAVSGSISISRLLYLIKGTFLPGNEIARAVCGFAFTLYLISRAVALLNSPAQEESEPEAEEYEADCGGNTFICIPEITDSEGITASFEDSEPSNETEPTEDENE